MFTATTFYRICIGLMGAVSVRGGCTIEPDKDGSVVIPDGTETIALGLFQYCDALKKIVIPASVKNIGKFAFDSAVNLKEVVFREGSNLKDIEYGAFYNCGSLERFDFPNSLKKIGKRAFSESGLKKALFFNNGIGVIGNDAFSFCKSLKKIKFPRSLKRIGARAFRESGLEEVYFRNNISKDRSLESIGNKAFRGNKNLKTINVPTGVDIGEKAFIGTGCRNPSDLFVPGAKIVNCSLEE